MKKKILGIFVMTLLIAVAMLPVVAGVVDQQQPNTSQKEWLSASIPHWQQFVPQVSKLKEVELHIGNWFTGSEPITLSIEETVGGAPLTSVTEQAVNLPYNTQDWFTFNVPDVSLTIGKLCHIVLRFDPGSEYAWSGDVGDPYPTGGSNHPNPDWDYAFRTHVTKSRPRTVNTPFLSFLQNHPNLFPILQRLLPLRFGL